MTLSGALPQPKPFRSDLGAVYATGLGSHFKEVMKKDFGSRTTDYITNKEQLDKALMFFKNDGKVLRFQCVEVNSTSPPYFPELNQKFGYDSNDIIASGNVKRFALSYYLSSSTIDLLVQGVKGKKLSSLNDPKVILKKTKVPINWREVQNGLPGHYYQLEDFQCGNVVEIFGKFFLLLFCDSFTKKYYRDLGIDQSDILIITEEPEPIIHPIPKQGDGFLPIGGAEDSLATVYGMPKFRRDEKKAVQNQGKQITTRAVLCSDNPIDSSRSFILIFFLEDDTLQVIEELQKNNGIWGGNFLKRGSYMNDLPTIPRKFIPQDIYFGNVVAINGYLFRIIELDVRSQKIFESEPDKFPMSDSLRFLSSILNVLVQDKIDIRRIFIEYDKKKTGILSRREFIDKLDDMKLIDDLNDQELISLIRRFKDKGEFYSYREFCDLLSHLYFHSNHTSNGRGDDYIKSIRDSSVQWRRFTLLFS